MKKFPEDRQTSRRVEKKMKTPTPRMKHGLQICATISTSQFISSKVVGMKEGRTLKGLRSARMEVAQDGRGRDRQRNTNLGKCHGRQTVVRTVSSVQQEHGDPGLRPQDSVSNWQMPS